MQERTNGMSLDGFCTCVKYDVRKKMGMDYEVHIQNVTKNNDIELKGLIITSPNTNVSPTIYLNPYYIKYVDGEDYDKLVEDIVLAYEKNKATRVLDVSFFKDWKKARERIVFKLVSYERNRELLKNVPHVRYLDLAVVFNYWVKTPCGEFGTILIHNEHLSMWSVTKDELYDIAIANTPELLPYRFEDMVGIMAFMAIEGELPFGNCDIRHPMYILTNQYKINGAGCILYPELLKTLADKMESDLCIIPSSIHETLIIPVMPNGMCCEMDWDEVTEMVKEVNETQLMPGEILSDHAYKYVRVAGEIVM